MAAKDHGAVEAVLPSAERPIRAAEVVGALLLEAEGFDVVGEAMDGASAVALARTLASELVLLDVGLPDMDGFAVCDALLEDDAGPAVVLTSSRGFSSARITPREMRGTTDCRRRALACLRARSEGELRRRCSGGSSFA